ncbi:unnamed protein product, partial [Lampetra planeri]
AAGGRTWRSTADGCETAGVAPVLVDPGDPSHRPFLVVRARQVDGKHRIRKRGLECDGTSGACAGRQQFYIDFRLIRLERLDHRAGWLLRQLLATSLLSESTRQRPSATDEKGITK